VEALNAILYYIADPMCSWCWGFHPVLQKVKAVLPADVPLRYVMGGLAKDSDEPMTDEVLAYVQNAWQEVSARTGATFNRDFWTRCKPRRSTYPACRAVLCAAAQREDVGPRYFEAVQRAYYQEARNPSDADTLAALAEELGLNAAQFTADLVSQEIDERLRADFALRRRLGIRQFPSLVLEQKERQTPITIGYDDAEAVLSRLAKALDQKTQS
jgi:putative protein-disulfide isomerase